MPENVPSGFRQTPRVDFASILGLCIAIAAILGGLAFEGGRVADIAQATAALIVFGGTLGAVLVTTPMDTFLAAMQRSSEILVTRSQPFAATMDRLLTACERARKNGIACLEADAARTPDLFLRKGLDLAADGTREILLKEIMLLDQQREEDRNEAEIRVWENAAGYSPTVGIMGAVLGLIQVMKHLDNVNEVGRGIAVAFVATVYGVAGANLIFLPVAGKLRARSHSIAQLHEMMLEGLLAIVDGMNPTLMRIKLQPFLAGQRDRTSANAERIATGSLLAEQMPEAQS